MLTDPMAKHCVYYDLEQVATWFNDEMAVERNLYNCALS